MKSQFSLFIFSTDVHLIQTCLSAGIEGVVVDWEQRGKEIRQAGVDTQINHDTPQDLRRVREGTSGKIICRINPLSPQTLDEVEVAIQAGADEILLPMVRSAEEVREVLDLLRGRLGLGILIETMDAEERAAELAHFPLTRVYVGLNDLMIDRGQSNLFLPLMDGTLDRIRSHFRVPFGFGGLTIPEKGDPILCRLLMGEMARLNCRFSFLRRSFLRDVPFHSVTQEVPKIFMSLQNSFERSPEEIINDRRVLVDKINTLT